MYEAPPDYEDIIKVGMDQEMRESRQKQRRHRKHGHHRYGLISFLISNTRVFCFLEVVAEQTTQMYHTILPYIQHLQLHQEAPYQIRMNGIQAFKRCLREF